jgi:thiol-disulfide isomerase/thioredoxin
MDKKGGFYLIGIVVLVLLGIGIGWWLFYPDADVEGKGAGEVAGEVAGDAAGSLKDKATEKVEEEIEEIIIEQNNANSDWKDYSLTDVSTGESFALKDFEGKKVLLESFAVWCPKCTEQQNYFRDLKSIVGDSVVFVSLATDPGENSEIVANHISTNGFDWYYAVASTDMVSDLVDEFGAGIVSAPSVPIVLICEDGSFRKLSGIGPRDAGVLQEDLSAGC